MVQRKLIFGCGYLGLRAARLWRDAGDEVIAVTRSPQRAAQFVDSEGLQALVADVVDPASLGHLPPVDSLLYSVGFDRGAGGDIHGVYAGGLRNVLAALPTTVNRVIYVSTTGVYGSATGEWVDEQTPCDPRREGARASLAAEQVFVDHPLGKRSAILRLAGLYGPGRVPHLEKLRAGEPIPAPPHGWLNLIHVDDAARAVVAVDQWLAARHQRGEEPGPHIFNVSDGCPVLRGDYYREVARLIAAPPPQFAAPDPHSPAAVRAEASRRVSSAKLLREIGVPLQFPDYRAALAAILAGER